MKVRKCEECIRRKNIYCPNTKICYSTENKPYYLDNFMALELIEKQHERIFYLENKVVTTIEEKLNKAKIELYKNYVHKAKIREKIEDFEERECDERYDQYDIIEILKEILGE